ncbi:hypothetical protein [Mesorhizobium sp. M0129]|uniref:hypothetical protein n=1 Tax=Mesorhizobium sp. M0129 TaxID=2956886 RepID=UPI0033359FEE
MSDTKPMRPQKITRVAGRCYYLGPNHNAPAMRLPDAKAAFDKLAKLRVELAGEVTFSKATGFGDHAKIGRLVAEIAMAEGRS